MALLLGVGGMTRRCSKEMGIMNNISLYEVFYRWQT